MPRLPEALRRGPFREGFFPSRLHEPRTAVVLGRWLGLALTICFLTGLVSHALQNPPGWLAGHLPSRPADGYRVTAAKSFAEAQRETDPEKPTQLLIATLADDGEKFARKLLAAQPALRVLCTSNNDVKLPLAWLPPSRVTLLNKPYALSELLRAARKLLDAEK